MKTIKQRIQNFFLEAHTENFIKFLTEMDYLEKDPNPEDLQDAIESLLKNGNDLYEVTYEDNFLDGYSFMRVFDDGRGDGNEMFYIFNVTTPTETFYFQINGIYSSWDNNHWNENIKEAFYKENEKVLISYFTCDKWKIDSMYVTSISKI